MKKIVFLAQLCCTSFLSFPQDSLRNFNWVDGSGPPIKICFGSSSVVVKTFSQVGPPLSGGSSCISDTNGVFSFLCNGFYVYDSSGMNMEFGTPNFDTINIPQGHKLFDYYYGQMFFNQTSIILPKKNNSYYVFTTGMSDLAYDDWKNPPNYPLDFRFDVLNFAVVNMDSNSGMGAVLEKNKILMQNAMLSHNRMTAVRHGNGIDWWLIKPHRHKQIYYNLKVTADSIYQPLVDSFFVPMDTITRSNQTYGIQGQCAFSPNGEWFASTEATNYGCFVYQFDRCTGHFTPYHFYPLPFIDTSYYPNYMGHSVGVCFSPNSKLLYLNTIPDIWQIDVSDTTANSPLFITGPDTMPGFPEYYNGYLAPNEKIYIGSWHVFSNSMPFIDSPDVRGLGCAFRGRGYGAFTQPFTVLETPPNMPFYGLGGNGLCIPTSTSAVNVNADGLVIYPNPSNTSFFIKNKKGKKKEMYNAMGLLIVTTYNDEIDVSRFAKGVYYIRCEGIGVKVLVE